MTRVDTSSSRANAISASWARCQQKHQLERDTTRPILRLQLSEISPRWELLLHRTSGGQGIFQHLAKSAAHADNCLVITDENGVLVQLECKHKRRGAADWNGIGLGSLWDERIAGTNGVAMALLEKQPFTVRGEEHYLSKLMHFSCTATPLLDAENQTIGALNLTSIDRGNSADYLLAKHLLEVAADRLQRSLFEQKYVDSQIFSVSLPNHKALFKSNEMIAINEKGLIIGSTTKAYGLFDLNSPHELVGKSFELLFGADPESLHGVDKLTHSDTTNNLALSIREHIPGQKFHRLNGDKQGSASSQCTHVNKSHFKRRSILELHELISSSSAVASLCKRSNQYFHHALPFIVEGASGTGKSSLINAIHESVKLHPNKILSIDCASLGDNNGDQTFIRNFVESTCTADSQKSFGKISSIVFDNIDELPPYAQAKLRSLLGTIESHIYNTEGPVSSPRIIATCKSSIRTMVEEQRFRQDLYYLFSGAVVCFPALSEREDLEQLVHSISAKLNGGAVEITVEAMQALKAYKWPGNIRQLQNVLKQALIESGGCRLSLLDLATTPVVESPSLEQPSFRSVIATKNLNYDESTMLLDALVGANWNVSKAARNLGIGRATIHRKIKLHGLTRPR